MTAIPTGFEPLTDVGAFQDLVGPFYCRRDPADYRVGLVVAEKHLNKRGIVHGGMICTLVDFAMGYAARLVTDPPRSLVTTNLSVDFAGNARPGDWIEARVDIMRPGRQVAFVNCFVYLGEARIARGSGTFLILRGRSS
jgi:acyl-coenzyme A thioesterase 13